MIFIAHREFSVGACLRQIGGSTPKKNNKFRQSAI
jgi:hypothetical protein